jgi:hypothetical protein
MGVGADAAALQAVPLFIAGLSSGRRPHPCPASLGARLPLGKGISGVPGFVYILRLPDTGAASSAPPRSRIVKDETEPGCL